MTNTQTAQKQEADWVLGVFLQRGNGRQHHGQRNVETLTQNDKKTAHDTVQKHKTYLRAVGIALVNGAVLFADVNRDDA